MKLRRPASRESPETIIALIDVVFFLLVFFLLIGRMDATAPFDVSPAIATSGADLPGGGITVAIGQTGATAIDGAEADRAAILAAIGARLDESPGIVVRINAHHEADLRHVLPLIASIETLGARDVVLVVTPESAP